MLTNNEVYLGPYQSALSAIAPQLDEIASRTDQNAGQSDRLMVLRQHVDAKLDELEETIELRRSRGIDAALALVNSDRGKIEMDAIRAQVRTMADEERRVRAVRLVEMEAAQQRALLSTLLSGALGILLTAAIGFMIRRTTIARRRDQWLQEGQVGLASATMGDQSIDGLGNSILDYLATYLGAVAGAIYVAEGDRYRKASAYGIPEGSSVPKEFRLREGLLGQAAAEQRSMVIGEVPTGYLAFGSALGSGLPRYLAIVPGVVDGDANSVIELGFMHAIDEKALALLERASEGIAISVRSAKYRGELQDLLEETQRQSEELQTRARNCGSTTRNWRSRGRALKESQARLEQQQVELEQTNSQLEEQAQQLEGQRDDLERANASVLLKARELEQASQYKSDFLANMSHELRTPLNSSLILARLLADNPQDNLTEEQVKFAKTIESSGNDLLNLINDILDLSKIEAGHVEIHPEIVPV